MGGMMMVTPRLEPRSDSADSRRSRSARVRGLRGCQRLSKTAGGWVGAGEGRARRGVEAGRLAEIEIGLSGTAVGLGARDHDVGTSVSIHVSHARNAGAKVAEVIRAAEGRGGRRRQAAGATAIEVSHPAVARPGGADDDVAVTVSIDVTRAGDRRPETIGGVDAREGRPRCRGEAGAIPCVEVDRAHAIDFADDDVGVAVAVHVARARDARAEACRLRRPDRGSSRWPRWRGRSRRRGRRTRARRLVCCRTVSADDHVGVAVAVDVARARRPRRRRARSRRRARRVHGRRGGEPAGAAEVRRTRARRCSSSPHRPTDDDVGVAVAVDVARARDGRSPKSASPPSGPAMAPAGVAASRDGAAEEHEGGAGPTSVWTPWRRR